MLVLKALLHAILNCVLLFQAFITQCDTSVYTTSTSVYDPCTHEELTEAEGKIAHPPQDNPIHHGGVEYHQEDCSWHISVESGNRVELHVHLQWIRSNDAILVYDGADDSAPLLITNWGGPKNIMLLSTSNEMFIEFRTGPVYSTAGAKLGFTANYKTISPALCGGEELTADEGMILSPGYPLEYHNNERCTWHITVTLSYRVELHVQIHAIETQPHCANDAILVYDGADDKTPLLAKECGENKNLTLLSTLHEMFVVFQSNDFVQMKGFVARYVIIKNVCDPEPVELTEAEGQFTSPGFPGLFHYQQTCIWHITVNESSRVELHVKIHEMFSLSWCNDNIQVHDGKDATAALLIRACSENTTILLLSTGNEMFIEFSANSYTRNKGFTATYVSTLAESCGRQELTADIGMILSPGYPVAYHNNERCTWHITVQLAYLVELHVQIDGIETHPNCTHDAILIYDGADDSATLLAKECGVNKTITVRSTWKDMFVVFQSDHVVQMKGFVVNYVIIKIVCDPAPVELTGAEGQFTSPGYPGLYHESQTCTWHITVEPGSRVQLNMQIMEVPDYENDCRNDIILIYDGADGKATSLLAKECVYKKNITLLSTRNELFVVLQSERVGRGKFTASYVTINPESCGRQELTADVGMILSPGYPLAYHNNERCTWHITGKTCIQLHVQIDSIETHPSCAYDAIMIYDGADDTAPVLAKECGVNKTLTVQATGNEMFVEFQSNEMIKMNGFVARYVTIKNANCPEQLTGVEGQFTSPGFPTWHSSSVEKRSSSWHITVQDRSHVELHIDIFRIVYFRSCRDSIKNSNIKLTSRFLLPDINQYVMVKNLDATHLGFSPFQTGLYQIYDGGDSSAPLLAEECAESRSRWQRSVRSTGNEMFVVFQSGSRDYYFIAKYVTISRGIT